MVSSDEHVSGKECSTQLSMCPLGLATLANFAFFGGVLMVLRKLVGIFAITLMIGAASFATAGVPDLVESTAVRAYVGPEQAVMFNIPNGGGSAFTSASIFGGTVDASITLTIRDGFGVAIANFPAASSSCCRCSRMRSPSTSSRSAGRAAPRGPPTSGATP